MKRVPGIRSLLLLGSLLMLQGCSILLPAEATDFPRYHEPESWPPSALEPMQIPALERMSYPDAEPTTGHDEAEVLYSFMINNMPVRDGLRLFARAYDLNVALDPDVEGILDVEFRDVSLEKALSLMLSSLDYYWEINDGVIRVRSQQTKRFAVDYLRLVRSGTGKSTATVSSASASTAGGQGSSGGEDADNGSISIEHEDEIRFWAELEAQLSQILSESGRMVVNRLSGTVQISDQHAFVRAAGEYIAHINRAIHRQVDIEVRILEVVLDDSTALGVNWSRVTAALDTGINFDFQVDGIVDSPAGGITPLSPVLGVDGFHLKDNGNIRLGAVIEALEQQGDVEIVSQPHVRTLNNQTSLIKVGTDRTFFRREQTTDSTSAGSTITAEDVPQVVTEGVVLSITPQIGEQGWVMMDVSPVVTRVSSVSVVEGPNGQIQSSAPNLDVAQVSSLIRARSGDTVVIGGLIQTQDSVTKRGIPGLTKLGPVGRAFGGGHYENRLRKELIMVLTPTIVPQES
ncbi:MAG: secretin N-terminal domain-containing protein [Pseudomonadota bacterium]